MSKKRFANVWDAIEDTPAQAENMKLRSTLMMALKDHIVHTGLSQSEAAKLLGVTQPRVSDLMRGMIELFGLDTFAKRGTG
jgi:predicted XRE-type DNA-binding protein